MTNLTYAELTAAIAVDGLTINETYSITDRGWVIIAITTSTYRKINPIVKDITKAELDAIVAIDGLNEGLQYHCVDTNIDWLLLATGNNTLVPVGDKITINAGDSIPVYVDTKFVTVITPTIVTSYLEDNYTIDIPASFCLVGLITEILGATGYTIIISTEETEFNNNLVANPGKYVHTSFGSRTGGILYISGFSGTTGGVKFTANFEKVF